MPNPKDELPSSMDPAEQTRVSTTTYVKMGLRSIGSFIGSWIPGVSSVSGFWGEWETSQKLTEFEARISKLEVSNEAAFAKSEAELDLDVLSGTTERPIFYQATGRIVTWAEDSLLLEVRDDDLIFQLYIRHNPDTKIPNIPKTGETTGVSFFVDEDGQCHALAIGRHLSKIALSAPTLNEIESIPSSRTTIAKIHVSGTTAFSEDEVLSVVSLQPGDLVSRSQLKADLQSIYDFGIFADVRFRLQEDSEGIRLDFLILENPTLEEIRLEGCNLIPENIIRESLGVSVGEVLNMSVLKTGLRKIDELYGDKGLTNIASHVAKVSLEDNILTLSIIEEFKPQETKFQGLLANIDGTLDGIYENNWLYGGIKKFFGSPTAVLATVLGITPGKPLTKDLLSHASETLRSIYKQLDMVACDVQYRFSENNQELIIKVTEGYLNDIVFTRHYEYFRSLTEMWKSRRIGQLISRRELEDFLAMVNGRSYVIDLSVDWDEAKGRPGHLNLRVNPQIIDLHSNPNWLEKLCEESPYFKKRSLAEVKILSLDYMPISNISDLVNLPGLENLDLQGTLVTKIDGLEHLSNLKTLILAETNIESIDAIKHLGKLQHLRIDKTRVQKLPPICSKEIRGIAADDSSLSDINEIKNLESLDFLSLSETQISDLSSLDGKRIRTLLCAGLNRVDDFSVIGTLKGLEILGLDRNNIIDFGFLKNLSALKNLYLGGYPFKDAPNLPRLSLKQLSFYDSKVSNLTSLACLETLEELYLQYSKVHDLTPLRTLSSLRYLDIRDTPVRREEAENLKKQIPEIAIYLSDPLDPEKSITL